jgi:signal transduction histidine kinase
MNTAKPVYDVRHAIEWPDGRRVLLSVNAAPLFDELQQVNGMVATVEDVTQRVRAEAALQQRTAQFEALQKVGMEVTAHLDLDALLRSVISQAINLVGGTEGGLYLYRPERDVLEWAVAIGPNVPPTGSILHRGEGLSGKVWQTGKPLVVDDYRHWEGRARIYQDYPFTSVVGIPIYWREEFMGVLNILADVPCTFSSSDVELLSLFANQATIALQNARLHQKVLDHAEQLERRVQERTMELEAQRTWLDAILHSTTDGIVVTDQAGNIVQTNSVAQTWLSQTLAAEDAGRLRDAIQNLAQQVDEMPTTMLELTGLDLELGAAPVMEQGADKPLGVVVDIHDVSHLREIDRMKTMFINNVSHELRTPIATIQLYAHLMRRTSSEKAEWRRYLDTLVQETDRQAQLGEDILHISNIYSGRLELDLHSVSLNKLAEAVIVDYQAIAHERGVRLEQRLAESDSTTLVDPEQMQMVLNNLVSDAIYYTPGGGWVAVSTGQKETDGHIWATVTVSDTGEAIPEEDRPHVFERFFRKEEPLSVRVTETGLRLMIVKGIVELHRGRVTVESTNGVGATFTIWLPLVN